MTRRARRSAGASAPTTEPTVAQHAASEPVLVSRPSRSYTLGVGMLTVAVSAGLLLSASGVTEPTAAAAPEAASVRALAWDAADDLSRGAVDREAAVAESPAAAPSSASATVMYVASAAYLRSGPSTSAAVVTTLAAGTRVSATGAAADGWQQVTAASSSGYVKATLLTAKAPSATATTTTTTAAALSAYPACASGSAVETGLKANTILVHRAVCATFPSITSYGGVRGDGSEHAGGLALDIMVSGDQGVAVAAWLKANYATLGVVEIIYQQKIWTTQRASEGWRALADRGSATANHYDHIHVLVS